MTSTIWLAGCSADTSKVVDAPGDPDAAATDTRSDAAVPDASSNTLCGCFDGAGAVCANDATQLAQQAGCELGVEPGPHDVLRCADGAWAVERTCDSGCETGELAGTADCSLPVCDCFVRVSWCAASAARHGLTLDPPCRVPLADDHDKDILGCDGEEWIVLEACEKGCFEAPTGTPDACVTDRTPEDPGWEPCPSAARIASGVHPEASDRLRCAGVTADRITQTIGTAAASAGYHAADGTADGAPYTAAIDLRARDMTEAEIKVLLDRLGRNGFAAWYRKPGADGWPADEAPHIHAVFAGVPMKSQLRGQVRDFLVGRNGLASHTTYRFWTPEPEILEIVRLLFSRNYTP